MVLDRNNFSLRTITTSHVEDLVGGSGLRSTDFRHVGHVEFSGSSHCYKDYLVLTMSPGDNERFLVSTYEDRSMLMQLAIHLERRGLLLAECDFKPEGLVALPKIACELYSKRVYSVSRTQKGVYVVETDGVKGDKVNAAAYSPA